MGHWNRWGPYLSERAWGTVREDYSADGDAWSYFPHDHPRSKSYRWNEDGLGGICDRHQYMCFALALWNGRDSILKERVFGLTNSEGNHGEDVEEYFFHLDSTPTHSYMKFLYKYPQTAYPYRKLVEVNASRTRLEMEYELIDTGVFNGGRYFDVEIEYAKSAAEDVLVRIGISNRGPEPADVWALPTLWFRNTWSWGRDDRKPVVSELNDDRKAAGPVRSMLTAASPAKSHSRRKPRLESITFFSPAKTRRPKTAVNRPSDPSASRNTRSLSLKSLWMRRRNLSRSAVE